MHAVVLVSGGAAVTPYTTPDAAAATGLAAGNTMTAIRAALLERGHTVYTSPARVGDGQVREDSGWQGFGDVPEVLPAEITVNAVGTIDDAGRRLAAFLRHLAAEQGVESVDLVAHSMGGLFSRAAISEFRVSSGPTVQRLITIGTPWTGSVLGDYYAGDIALEAAHGHEITEQIFRETQKFAAEKSQGAADQVSSRYLTGESGWNARHAGELDGIAVTVIAGTYYDEHSEPTTLWPHDGLVQRASALALDVPTSVLPAHEAFEFDDIHSIFFANIAGIPWERAITWDPRVIDVIDEALRR